MSIPEKILLTPTGLSANDEVVHAHAVRIAISLGARLEVFHVEPPFGDDEWRWALPDAAALIERWNLPPSDGFVVRVRDAMVEDEAVDDTLVSEVARVGPVLLVLSAVDGHGGLLHVLRGAAAAANVPVLLVPPSGGLVDPATGATTLSRIVVPVDAHPNPHQALLWAAALARALGGAEGELVTLHVGAGPVPLEPTQLPVGWVRRDLVRAGDALTEITALAEGLPADLVIVPTEGRRGWLDEVRGSTTERLVPRLATPVLVVPLY